MATPDSDLSSGVPAFKIGSSWRAIAPIAVAVLLAIIPAPEGLSQHAWYYFAIFVGVIIGLMTPVQAWLGPDGFVVGVLGELDHLAQSEHVRTSELAGTSACPFEPRSGGVAVEPGLRPLGVRVAIDPGPEPRVVTGLQQVGQLVHQDVVDDPRFSRFPAPRSPFAFTD